MLVVLVELVVLVVELVVANWPWVSWVLLPTLPGGLPTTALPLTNGSRPAEHSCTWPGESVFGYGSEWTGPEDWTSLPV